MKRNLLLSLFLGFVFCATLNAQDTTNSSASNKALHPMNFIKLSLTSIAFKNYSLQYERILSKGISASLSYRLMPTSKIPFATSLANQAGNDEPDVKDAIEKLRMSNFAITPEIRFYLGKGYGKGFYIALFYRYASFTAEHFQVAYDDTHKLDMSGKLTANTGGIMFGAQWLLGKHFCLDWNIVGPHYGSASGLLTGVANPVLSPTQQDKLRSNLTAVDIPLTNETVTVNANGGTLKLEGPWGGIRSGISLGFRF